MNARVLASLVVLVLLAVPALALGADPDDPGFAGQWQFTGPAEGLPSWAPLARDPDNASGVNFTGAWRQGNLGRPDVVVAYIEGGVNYSSDGIKDALNNIFLNQGELPKPAGSDTYDADHNGTSTCATTRTTRASTRRARPASRPSSSTRRARRAPACPAGSTTTSTP